MAASQLSGYRGNRVYLWINKIINKYINLGFIITPHIQTGKEYYT